MAVRKDKMNLHPKVLTGHCILMAVIIRMAAISLYET